MNRVNMHCFWLSRKSFKIFLQKYTKAVCQCIKNSSSVFTFLQFTCIMQREINYIKCLPLLSWIIKNSVFVLTRSEFCACSSLSFFFWVIANGNKKSFCHFFTVRCILEAVSLNARNDSIYARFSMFQSNTQKKHAECTFYSCDFHHHQLDVMDGFKMWVMRIDRHVIVPSKA